MANTTNLSRLMRLSWDIQRGKKKNRSTALQAALVIFQNEHITVQYLTHKLNHHKPVSQRTANQFALFTHR